MTAATRITQLRAMLPPGMRERVDAAHKALNPDWRGYEALGVQISPVKVIDPHKVRTPLTPPAEPVVIARASAADVVREKALRDKALDAREQKRKEARTRPPGRRRVYATDADRRAAKNNRLKERREAEGATSQKPGPKPKYESREAMKAARLERARERYRLTHPPKPVIIKPPRERRKPGPVAGPKPVQIPRELCPHAEEEKRGFSADGRQKWRCKNCQRDRTENPRGPGRPRLDAKPVESGEA